MDEKKPIGVGSILGGFKIEKELGKGGMGTVYRAHELSLNRKVALKILSKRLSFDEEFVKRFKREAQVVAALNHPNIVNILSYGEEHGQQYFAMEYIKGKDLGQILEEKTVLPTQQALSVTAQVASALGEASVRGVIHRDLKPANIMIDELDCGEIPLEPYGVSIEDIPVKVTDWTGAPISGDRARVKIGDKVAAWAGESFIGSWTFTKKDETVAIKAEYVMSDGRTALGQYNLSLNQFDILDQPQSVSPITVTLQKPSPPPLAKIPTVLIAVSGDETIRPFVHANIETSLLGTGLKVTSASEIPVLYKKIQLGQTPITWYRLKQLVPKDRADILLLAEVQKTGSTTLEFYGLTEKLTIVSFSVRAVDMATGISAASPATGSVKFTSLNMEENFREALTPALLEMGQMIKRYWQDKIQAGKR